MRNKKEKTNKSELYLQKQKKKSKERKILSSLGGFTTCHQNILITKDERYIIPLSFLSISHKNAVTFKKEPNK